VAFEHGLAFGRPTAPMTDNISLSVGVLVCIASSLSA
jgi:hypothetical protein